MESLKFSKAVLSADFGKDDLIDATYAHNMAVFALVVNFVHNIVFPTIKNHDFTKLRDIDDFYAYLKKRFNKESIPDEENWFRNIHVVEERHHLRDRCPDDVHLGDVLEYLADCVVAGKLRGGQYYEPDIDPEILVKAFRNTAKIFVEAIKIKN